MVEMRVFGLTIDPQSKTPIVVLREASGGITMSGRLATQAARDRRVHLVGYGPSASTIGANRAGAAAASELMAFLGLTRSSGDNLP